MFTLFKTLISQKVYHFEQQNKIHIIKIKELEFIQFKRQRLTNYFWSYRFLKSNAPIFSGRRKYFILIVSVDKIYKNSTQTNVFHNINLLRWQLHMYPDHSWRCDNWSLCNWQAIHNLWHTTLLAGTQCQNSLHWKLETWLKRIFLQNQNNYVNI